MPNPFQEQLELDEARSHRNQQWFVRFLIAIIVALCIALFVAKCEVTINVKEEPKPAKAPKQNIPFTLDFTL